MNRMSNINYCKHSFEYFFPLQLLHFLSGLWNLTAIFPELSYCDKLLKTQSEETVSQHIRINSEVSKITALYTT